MLRLLESLSKQDSHFTVLDLSEPQTKTVKDKSEELLDEYQATVKAVDNEDKNIPLIGSPEGQPPNSIISIDLNFSFAIARANRRYDINEATVKMPTSIS